MAPRFSFKWNKEVPDLNFTAAAKVAGQPHKEKRCCKGDREKDNNENPKRSQKVSFHGLRIISEENVVVLRIDEKARLTVARVTQQP